MQEYKNRTMKKIGWSILIGLLTIVSLNAQETVNDNEKEEITFMPKHIIKIFPLSALVGEIGIGYERVIKPKTSLNFVLFQAFDGPDFDNSISERRYQLFFETGIRRYLSKRKKAPEGWFVSGGLLTEYNYNKLKNKTNNQITDIERLWVGASVRTGYQWIFKKALKGMSTEIVGGLDYRTATGIFDGGNVHEINVNINFTIGYSW